jgi:preprotein translocase subunit SecG
MLYQVIIVFHLMLGVGVIGLVLMQQGKGADAGATFGGGASGSVFGAQGSATFLSKTTAIFATLFFITSLSLAVLSGSQHQKADIMDAPAVQEIKSDVPLASETQAQPATKDSMPAIELPAEQAVKVVEPAQAK